MTNSANTAQAGLDTLLALLEKNNAKRKKRRPFRGTGNDDMLFGNDKSNTANGGSGNDVLMGKGGDDRLSGGDGTDLLFGGDGNDRLSGGNKRDLLFGDAGDDLLRGGNGNDSLDGGAGKDTIDGGIGNDTLVGGDGVDILTGGTGSDQFTYGGNVFANGIAAPAGTTGISVLGQPDIIKDYTIGEDKFVLQAQDLNLETLVFQKGTSSQLANGNVLVLTDPFPAAGAAARAIANNSNITADAGIFVYFNTTLKLTRVVYSKDLGNGGDISVLANFDNQRGDVGLANIASFSEADFHLFGGNGASSVIDNNGDNLFGDAGDNLLDGGKGDDVLTGKAGNDTLLGGSGNDMLVGGDGIDNLTGNTGRDQFVYRGNVFANGTLAPAGATGINALNKPDIITDYTLGEDQFVLDGQSLGIDNIVFQKGASSQLANGNVIVLTDPFPAAGAAARAIANNDNITATKGAFVYFNTTLGLTRLVFSNDLGTGGNISVLANLDNQRGQVGQTNIASFSAADFSLG
jgi:serralysin